MEHRYIHVILQCIECKTWLEAEIVTTENLEPCLRRQPLPQTVKPFSHRTRSSQAAHSFPFIIIIITNAPLLRNGCVCRSCALRWSWVQRSVTTLWGVQYEGLPQFPGRNFNQRSSWNRKPGRVETLPIPVLPWGFREPTPFPFLCLLVVSFLEEVMMGFFDAVSVTQQHTLFARCARVLVHAVPRGVHGKHCVLCEKGLMLLSAECVHIIYVSLSNVKGIVLHFGEHSSSLAGSQM